MNGDDIPNDVREEANNAYSDSMERLDVKQKLVKNGETTSEQFGDWVIKTRNEIDAVKWQVFVP